ncbi:MAG: hypothetical protein ACR2GB_08940, partial [Nocardioidaceae bacterium]
VERADDADEGVVATHLVVERPLLRCRHASSVSAWPRRRSGALCGPGKIGLDNRYETRRTT